VLLNLSSRSQLIGILNHSLHAEYTVSSTSIIFFNRSIQQPLTLGGHDSSDPKTPAGEHWAGGIDPGFWSITIGQRI
jgi:hypothetical protein